MLAMPPRIHCGWHAHSRLAKHESIIVRSFLLSKLLRLRGFLFPISWRMPRPFAHHVGSFVASDDPQSTQVEYI